MVNALTAHAECQPGDFRLTNYSRLVFLFRCRLLDFAGYLTGTCWRLPMPFSVAD